MKAYQSALLAFEQLTKDLRDAEHAFQRPEAGELIELDRERLVELTGLLVVALTISGSLERHLTQTLAAVSMARDDMGCPISDVEVAAHTNCQCPNCKAALPSEVQA